MLLIRLPFFYNTIRLHIIYYRFYSLEYLNCAVVVAKY